MTRKYSSKRNKFLGFYLYFCHVIQSFICFIATLRQVEFLIWQNPEQLFVAQMLVRMLKHNIAEIMLNNNRKRYGTIRFFIFKQRFKYPKESASQRW